MKRIVVAVLACAWCAVAGAQLSPGSRPPDALGHTRGGEAVTVSSLHGKVVVVSFWATWCHYCLKEMPVLQRLQALASKRGLPLQVVSVDYQEDRRTFVNSARILGRDLPDLLLTWDRTGSIGQSYGADKGIPVMVMLHRDGTVAHVHVGYGADMLDSILSEINALLLEPASPPASAPLG